MNFDGIYYWDYSDGNVVCSVTEYMNILGLIDDSNEIREQLICEYAIH